MLGGVELVKNNSPNLNKNDLKNDIEQIVEIEIDKLKNFEKHPFKVVDETLEELITSITENGVTTPLIVRTLKDGNYEIVSGHRRKRACELLEITKLPCIVRDISRDEAIIQMVDSNIQREKVLPSERAFAYKMKLDAINVPITGIINNLIPVYPRSLKSVNNSLIFILLNEIPITNILSELVSPLKLPMEVLIISCIGICATYSTTARILATEPIFKIGPLFFRNSCKV